MLNRNRRPRPLELRREWAAWAEERAAALEAFEQAAERGVVLNLRPRSGQLSFEDLQDRRAAA